MNKVKVTLDQHSIDQIGQVATQAYLKQLGDHCVFCGKPVKHNPDAPAGSAPVCAECAKEHGLTPAVQEGSCLARAH